jgi:environmental stress-induced protein Ves
VVIRAFPQPALRATVVRRTQARAVPWANGLGTSHEIARRDDPAGPDGTILLWRLATTRIERDCPFSRLPGQDRTIVLLSGNGFELSWPAGSAGSLLARAPFDRLLVSGDEDTTCRLLDGPVEVLNLMVARGRAALGLATASLGASTGAVEIATATRAIHVLRGDVVITVEREAPVSLRPGDTACLEETASHGSRAPVGDGRRQPPRMRAVAAPAEVLLLQEPM